MTISPGANSQGLWLDKKDQACSRLRLERINSGRVNERKVTVALARQVTELTNQRIRFDVNPEPLNAYEESFSR